MILLAIWKERVYGKSWISVLMRIFEIRQLLKLAIFRWNSEKVILYCILCVSLVCLIIRLREILGKSITIYCADTWDVVQNSQISRNIFILEIWSFDLMVVIFRFLAYVSRAFRIHIHAMHREFLRVASDVSNVLVWIQSALINNDVLTWKLVSIKLSHYFYVAKLFRNK